MSWTYSGNPKNSVLDTCRFLIADTVQDSPLLQDEEIQYLIDEAAGNTNKLYYLLFDRAATLLSRDIKKSLGPMHEDPSSRAKAYADKAAMYKSMINVAGVSMPKFAYPKVFRKGMQNNPPWPFKGGQYLV